MKKYTEVLKEEMTVEEEIVLNI